MKKFLFLLILILSLLLNGISGTALTLSPIDISKLPCDLTRGTEIEIPDFDLTKEGAVFNSRTTVRGEFCLLDGAEGCYRLTPETGRGFSSKEFSLKPNRNYIISALINCEYNRDSCEVSLGFEEFDENGASVLYNYIGTPNLTDGWYRFEGTVTTSSRTQSGIFSLSLYGFNIPDTENEFYISDLHIIELPEVALTSSEPGGGMIFGGSSGMYDMKVTDVTENEKIVSVKTTGAEYVFDKYADTVSAYQLINENRLLFTAQISKSLSGLEVVSQSNNEAVLTTGNDGITLGVQMDSLMLIANHGEEELELRCVSAIAGEWNRLSQGNLMAKDDTGGFTINPYIPMGTGRLARYEADSSVDFDGIVNNVDFISSSPAGWSVDYTISDGELLGMSVFPAREFDWPGSFDNTATNYYFNGNTDRYAQDAEAYGIDIAVLWNFTQRGWGMSFGNKYNPLNEQIYIKNITSAHNAGMKAAPYMSMHYWHNRDVDEYIAEVKRHRDTYDIDGIYSDGLPDKEWLAAYEGVRKLRELFPDGPLIFHTTGQTGNGGPPMAVPDISIPAIDSYGTMTLRGEGVKGTGEDWQYPKSIASGYNTSNAFGLMKGDAWYDDTEENLISQRKQDLLSLINNGRARMTVRGQDAEDYKDILNRLKISYVLSGDKNEYLTERYMPLLHGLVRDDLSFDEKEGFEYDFSSSADIYNWQTFSYGDSAASLSESSLCISDSVTSSVGGVIHKIERHPSLMELSFKMKLDEGAGGEIYLADSNDKKCVGLYALDGDLRYYGHLKGYKNAASYNPGEWIDVVLLVDNSEKTFSVKANGKQIVSFDYLAYGTLLPDKLVLSTSNAAEGNIYFDDIKLRYGY